MMRNILLHLQFVGTNYGGWQRQKTALSIQTLVESAVEQITGRYSTVTGCSRTDAGVHAEHFIANFRTESSIPAEKFAPALQTKLPRDICVMRSREVDPDFHARRSSYEKTYRYNIFMGFSPFNLARWWQLNERLSLEILQPLAAVLCGTHDFTGFCVARSLKPDNRCTIKQAAWRQQGKSLYFKVTGDRFLHRMVRFLVGAQYEVATNRLSEADFREILDGYENRRAKFSAPPGGLYLVRVKYR